MNVAANILELEGLMKRIGTIVDKVGQTKTMTISARAALDELKKATLLAGTKASMYAALSSDHDTIQDFEHFHTNEEILEAVSRCTNVYVFTGKYLLKVYKSSVIGILAIEKSDFIATMHRDGGDIVLTINMD